MTATTFRHTDKGVWSTDASELGLAPGDWPEEITAEIQGQQVRARQMTVHRDSGREITHVEYAPFGRKFRMIVWND